MRASTRGLRSCATPSLRMRRRCGTRTMRQEVTRAQLSEYTYSSGSFCCCSRPRVRHLVISNHSRVGITLLRSNTRAATHSAASTTMPTGRRIRSDNAANKHLAINSHQMYFGALRFGRMLIAFQRRRYENRCEHERCTDNIHVGERFGKRKE